MGTDIAVTTKPSKSPEGDRQDNRKSADIDPLRVQDVPRQYPPHTNRRASGNRRTPFRLFLRALYSAFPPLKKSSKKSSWYSTACFQYFELCAPGRVMKSCLILR